MSGPVILNIGAADSRSAARACRLLTQQVQAMPLTGAQAGIAGRFMLLQMHVYMLAA